MNTDFQTFDIFRDLYLNSFSVGALIPVAFFAIAGFFLLSVKNKSRATLHMGIAYIMMGLFNLGYVIAASIYHPFAAYHRWMAVPAILLAEIHTTVLFFYYPEERNLRAAKLYLIGAYAVVISIFLYYFFQTLHSEMIYILLGQYWDFNVVQANKIVAFTVLGFVMVVPVLTIWRMLTCKGRERWILLAMAFSIVLGSLIPAIANLLSRDGIIDRTVFQAMWTLLTVLGFFLLIMFYVNNAKEKISFIGKLIMVSAITILAIIHFISYFTLQERDTAYDHIHRKDVALVLKTAYRSPDLAYIAEYDIDSATFIDREGGGLPIDSQKVTGEIINTAIYEGIRQLPATNFASNLKLLLDKTPSHFDGYRNSIMEYAKQIPQADQDPGRKVSLYIDSLNKMIFVQFNKISRLPEEDFDKAIQKHLLSTDNWFAPYKSVIQKRLRADSQNSAELKSGVLQCLLPMQPEGKRIYRVSKSGGKHYISYMEVDLWANKVFEIGFSYTNYRQYMHDAVFKFVIMIIILVFLSRYILYWFLKAVLMKPLKALSKGVYAVDTGNYDISVPVFVEDEIGHIARSFNSMVVSIREGKQKLSDHANSLLSAQTSLEESHREIRILQHYLSNIIESMPSVLISINEDGKVTQWNAAAEKLTGIRATEILGRKLWSVRTPFYKLENYYRDVILSRQPLMFTRERLEYTSGEKNKYYNIALYPLVADGISGAVVRIDDITEQEKIEQQLRQSQKMETVGTLAGGLAHDFNNVLGGIVGTISILKFKLNKGVDVPVQALKDYVETIERAGQRAADMVQQLLTLSRKQELSFAPVDLNLTIKHVFKICSNTIDKAVEIKPCYKTEPAMVNADPGQMEQVLLNLSVNAGHAMTIMRNPGEHHGGTLTISLRSLQADRFFCSNHPEAQEIGYWVLSVQDTGTGMDSKTVAKIFDPFFTTKETGKGTGLGLSMVYNIIQQHKGFIDVYSEIGHGTTFNVYLPSIECVQGVAACQEELKLAQGEGVILVVDDEAIIRELAQEILTECGYQVLLAENGEEGVEVFRKEHERINMVLLDMVMPKKSGKEAFIEMKKIDPNVKVLLASGFRKDDRVEDVLILGMKGFIQKPFTIERLAEAVSETIKG